MNSTRSSPKGISEKNRRLLTFLYRGVKGPFTVREAASILPFPIPRTQRFLAYLADRGWLVRIRRGLYAPVALETAEPSLWREDPWVIASRLFGPSYYIGGWTACEHWGLTEQIFRETVVVTTRRVRRKAVEVQSFLFRVKRATAQKMFAIRPVWRGQTRVNVSDPSHTVADILAEPSLGGGIRHVADVLHTYLGSEHRNDVLLAEDIQRIGNGASFKRLGYLLEVTDTRAPVLIKASKTGVSSGISLLDPSLPARGPILTRWNLRVNATIVPERVAV